MTQVVIGADAGNKRHLPTWMLQVNAAEKLRKTGNGGDICTLSEEQPETHAAGSKIEPISRKLDKTPTQETDTTQQIKTLQRCEVKQRTRKATRRDEDCSNSITSGGGARKKLKKETAGGERKVNAAPRKQTVKSRRPKYSDVEAAYPKRSDDEIELTVEDLMSIAEEYVNADKEKQHELPATRESTSETNPLSLSISSKADMRGPHQATGSGQILSKCTTNRCSSRLTETEGKERENLTIENFATSFVRTGDAAQDMLDLFLGPLLKKLPPKERDLGAIESEGLTLVRDSDKQVRSRAVLKEEAPLMKKKSSLKDKVAMFLD